MWRGVLDLFQLVRATARYPCQKWQPYIIHAAARLVDSDILAITYVNCRSIRATKGSYKPQNVESPEPPLFNHHRLPSSLRVPDHHLYSLLCNLDRKIRPNMKLTERKGCEATLRDLAFLITSVSFSRNP